MIIESIKTCSGWDDFYLWIKEEKDSRKHSPFGRMTTLARDEGDPTALVADVNCVTKEESDMIIMMYPQIVKRVVG